jgi:uncharacterized metal-binding protein
MREAIDSDQARPERLSYRGGMKAVLRPLPVVFACRGCPEFGNRAAERAAELDRSGLAEACALDEVCLAKARSRYPVHALDGCSRGCALRWLAEHGIGAHRHEVLGQ